MTADELYAIFMDDSPIDEVFREGRLDAPARLYRVWRHRPRPDNFWAGRYEDIAPDAPEWAEVAARLKTAQHVTVATPIDTPWEGQWCKVRAELR